jgi:hypothetical protein
MNKPKVEPPRRLQQLAHPAMAHSRSEGFQLSIVQGDKEGTTFGIDISKAPAPTREYASEVCSVIRLGDEVRFIFGQAAIGADDLDSVLVVRLNPQAARQMAMSIDEMSHPTLAEIAAAIGISPSPLVEIKTRPKQMAMVVANLAAIAVSGFETCIDFYRASPFAMRDAPASKSLGVEPVVRVDIQTAQFLSIVVRLKDITHGLPALPEA